MPQMNGYVQLLTHVLDPTLWPNLSNLDVSAIIEEDSTRRGKDVEILGGMWFCLLVNDLGITTLQPQDHFSFNTGRISSSIIRFCVRRIVLLTWTQKTVTDDLLNVNLHVHSCVGWGSSVMRVFLLSTGLICSIFWDIPYHSLASWMLRSSAEVLFNSLDSFRYSPSIDSLIV